MVTATFRTCTGASTAVRPPSHCSAAENARAGPVTVTHRGGPGSASAVREPPQDDRSRSREQGQTAGPVAAPALQLDGTNPRMSCSCTPRASSTETSGGSSGRFPHHRGGRLAASVNGHDISPCADTDGRVPLRSARGVAGISDGVRAWDRYSQHLGHSGQGAH